MSNLAVGIALGSSMNYASSYCGSNIDMPAWVAVVLLLTLTISTIGTVAWLYIKDNEIIESHLERCVFGSILGICLWACIVSIFALFGWLISFII